MPCCGMDGQQERIGQVEVLRIGEKEMIAKDVSARQRFQKRWILAHVTS